jgi:hypothetical protein
MNPLDQFFDLLVRVSAEITEDDLQDEEMQALVGQFLTIMNPPAERLDMDMLEQLGSISDKHERFRQAATNLGYHQPEDLHGLTQTLKAHDLFKGEQ